MVVSVDPCITDAIFPIILSGPYLDRISFNITNELEPDMGLKRDNGKSSTGKFIWLNSGLKMLLISWMRLLLVRTVMAITIAKMVGKRFMVILSPSFTPRRKVSKTSIFLYRP